MRTFILSLAALALGAVLLTPGAASAQNGSQPVYSNGGSFPTYGNVYYTPQYYPSAAAYSYPAYATYGGTYYNPYSARYPSYYYHSPGYTTTMPTYYYYRPGYGYTYSRGSSY
jgi:hypothetical protein